MPRNIYSSASLRFLKNMGRIQILAASRFYRAGRALVAALGLPVAIYFVYFVTAAIFAGLYLPSPAFAADSTNPRPPAVRQMTDAAPITDDKPEPLAPGRARSEDELDRIEAISLFAAGRAHELRGEGAAALRLYERALRRDPKSAAAARALVNEAFHLNRQDEAVRYALKTLDMQDADPLLYRRLAVYLVGQGDLSQAVKLYEMAQKARTGPKDNSADFLMSIEMGRLYHVLGDHKNAADCFARVMDALARPKDFKLDDEIVRLLLRPEVATFNLMGESFLQADRPAEAMAAFEKADKADPGKSMLDLHRAEMFLHDGNTDRALAALDDLYKRKPRAAAAAACRLLASVLDKAGKTDELIPRLKKYYAADNDDLATAIFLADQYRGSQQYDKAELLYRSALRKSPEPDDFIGLELEIERDDPLSAILSCLRGLSDIELKARRIDDLLSSLGEIVDRAGVLDAFGADVMSVSQNAEVMRDLENSARKRLQLNPQEPDYGALMALGLLELECKRFDAAGEFFDAALKVKPAKSAELLMVWGVALMVADAHAEAVEVFRRGIDRKALPGDNPLCYFYLAGALSALNRHDEAVAAARKAAEVKPDLRNLGRAAWALYRAKRYDDALKSYGELVDKFDGVYSSAETRAALREARLSMSSICSMQNRFEEAEEWLEQVLDEFPDDVSAANDLGYLWADAGVHLARAEKMIRRAVKAEPENAAFLDSLGWVYHRLGRGGDAVAELEKAAAINSDPTVLDHLGDAYISIKEPHKAVDAWRRALESLKIERDDEKAKLVEKKIQQTLF
jgi:tetratricopeptide (TPR) repeat protein